ncbi:MAG: hypothetical protein EHM45_05955 [Desulfobacteraceae bacterium]|nr:MAG: hypothetical protein EHM45_05955 [Desulfobacteraceae bacterium]
MKRTSIILIGFCVLGFWMQSAEAANLQLTRIQLRFENNRATLTVKNRQPDVQAFADILFTGTGLLQGYWQVDGRLIAHVNKHLVPGKKVTLSTPLKPALPTFSEGPHIVMFVVNRPAQPIPFPKALYYVVPGETPNVATVNLTQPLSESEIDPLQTTFQWEGQPKVATYLIEFIDDNPQKPLFSAITEKPEYVLPQPVLKYSFAKNQHYFWRVRSFDASYNVIGESEIRELRLK